MRTRSHRHAQADEQALQLRTSIAAVANVQPQGQGISLELLDTPGPNEAGEEHLRCTLLSRSPYTSACARISAAKSVTSCLSCRCNLQDRAHPWCFIWPADTIERLQV